MNPHRQHAAIDPTQLPHGEGFRCVTAVDDVRVAENGSTHGTGRWDLTGDERFFADHFPGRPVLPGVLLIESLAQFSGLVHYASDPSSGTTHAGIASVDVRLLKPVTPPARIVLETTSQETAGSLTRFAVSALVDGKRVARGSIFLTVWDAESPKP
ncbi:MAG: 3-hydroxyacyl-ACP dehydratase FabZ family protein [Phycisphaeraceae bacterium]